VDILVQKNQHFDEMEIMVDLITNS